MDYLVARKGDERREHGNAGLDLEVVRIRGGPRRDESKL